MNNRYLFLKSSLNTIMRSAIGVSIFLQPVVGTADESFDWLAEQCKQKESWACNNLGYRYSSERQEYATSYSFFKKACKLGEPMGCFNQGRALLLGEGVARDPAYAFKLMDKSCRDKDEEACKIQGILYESGQGTAKDLQAALRLYQRACELGSAGGCYNQGALSYQHPELPRGKNTPQKSFQKACELKLEQGCKALRNLQSAPEQHQFLPDPIDQMYIKLNKREPSS
ncbi:MAG: sel1 repeat family protein [Succinivibrio sp.]|nr:sel1 repeat family protein [Succinivibrio sp.]